MYDFYEEIISTHHDGEVVWSRRVDKRHSVYITKETSDNSYFFDVYDEVDQKKIHEPEETYASFNDAVDAAEDYVSKHLP